MPKITQITHNDKTDRVAVYIDFHFCASIKRFVWENMGLTEGSEISYSELHKKEALVWAQSNKKNPIFNSKHAINRTLVWLNRYLPNLDSRIIDFRFGYSNRPSSVGYPNTRNDQNISLLLKGTSTEVITLEVTSAEIQRGINYWVKADKIAYAQSQSDRDTWVVLYYKHPQEQFIWIHPVNDKKYKSEELIGNTKNYFVAFNDRSPEVHSSQDFCKYIQNKIEEMISELKLTIGSSDNLQMSPDKNG
jgi:hypothetical protein